MDTVIREEIVVITAGWVVMGMVEEKADRVLITEASVVRSWGTTAGLGEIALNGPTPNTVLDPAGVVECYKEAVIMRIPCAYR
jgi:hypothetical protein